MKTHSLSRFVRSLAVAAICSVGAAHAQITHIDWLDMSTPTNGSAIPLTPATAVPSGAQFAMPGGGGVVISHTIPAEANMGVRQQSPAMSNGTVPGYQWGVLDAIGSSPLDNPLYRSYTITYTFSPAIPAGRLVLGVSGLGRSSNVSGGNPGAESNIKVEANGSTTALGWQMLGDYAQAGSNYGATEILNAVGTGLGVAGSPIKLRNAAIGPAGDNPHWNSKFGIILLKQAVSSLTLTVNHVRGDGFSIAIGTLGEKCWVSGRDLATNEAIAATEKLNPNATVPEWSYGYRGDIASTAITTFTSTQHFNLTTGFSAGVEGFDANLNSHTPHVRVNPTSSPIVRAPMLNLDPQHMEVHPGPPGVVGDVVVVRWKAPAAGDYEIHATWRDNNSSDVTVGGNGAIGAIVREGTTLFSTTWANGDPAVSHTIPSVFLLAGERIDFVVDANGNHTSDSTDLDAEVCRVGMPEIAITDNGTPPPTDLVDNVTPVKFECIGVNTTSVRNLSLSNAGTGTLYVSSVTKSGPNAGDFTVSPSLVGATVGAGNTFPFTITFMPSTTGVKNAVIHVTSNDANGDEVVFDIKVTGCGCMPEISIFSWISSAWLTDNIGGIKFGTVQTCSSASDDLYIFNEGCDCPLTVKAWSITGTNAADFHLVNPPSFPQTVTSGPLVLNVEFAPTSNGVKTAVLHIVSDDPNETSFEINLTGTGAGQNIQVKQGSTALTNNGAVVDFGNANLGIDVFKSFTICNNGTAGSVLQVGQPTVVPSGVFNVGTSWTGTKSLNSGTCVTISIAMLAQTAPGCFEADILIPSNDCNDTPFIIHVTGSAGINPAPVFTSQPANQIAYLGDPVSFTATATCACPVESYTWVDGTNAVVGTSQTLTIPYAFSTPYFTKLNFATKALCDGKTTKSNIANLTVVECLPHTTADRLPGGSVSFTAQAWNATGYQWRKISGSGSPLTITSAAIPGATASGFTGSTLMLTGLQSAAAGEYVCYVSGHPGTTPLPTKPFRLKINDSAIPFPTNAVGTYGAVIERGACNSDNGGWLGFTIGSTGAVTTASVKLGSLNIPLTLTQQNVVSYTTATITGVLTNITVVPPVSVEFAIDVATRRFVVGVPGAPSQVTRFGSSSIFQGWKREPVSAPWKGLYNFAMDTPPVAALPQGWSWGNFNVATTGDYSISGKTACDEAFTFSMFISPGTAPSNQREIALFSMQPSGSSLVGIFEIVPGTPNLLQNSSLLPPTWKRPVVMSPIYGGGFGPITMTTEGGAYTLATPRVLGVPSGANNALVNFTDGGLPPPSGWNPDRYCTIVGSNYTLPAILNEQTTLTITGATGLITNAKFQLIDSNIYAPTGGLVTRKPTGSGIVIPLAGGLQEGRGYFILEELAAYYGAPQSKLSGGMRVH